MLKEKARKKAIEGVSDISVLYSVISVILVILGLI